MPRPFDFTTRTRSKWESREGQLVVECQEQIMKLMPNLEPLLPIKMGPRELASFATNNLTLVYQHKMLDGRSGMSYGFLASQLPAGKL